MDPIKEALTFDDVTLAPQYSEVLPSEVDTSIKLSKNIKLKPLASLMNQRMSYMKFSFFMSQPIKMGI